MEAPLDEWDIAESRLMRDFPVAGQEGGASPAFLLLRWL